MLVVLGAQGYLQGGALPRAEEERHAGHAWQVELFISLDDGSRQQVVDADPVTAAVMLDELAEEAVKGGVLAALHQSQPELALLSLLPQDLVADGLAQHGVGMLALQAGEEDLDLFAGLVAGQIGHRDPDPAERDIRALGEQLLSVGQPELHGGAEMHPLLLSAVVAGKGNGTDIEEAERAGGQGEALTLALMMLVPGLQGLVDPQGIAVAVEVALGLKQLDGLGRHEVGDPLELVYHTEFAQLIAHVDHPPAGGALALDLHLEQETAVGVFVLGQAGEELIEVLFSEQGDELFYQV
ncbi:hypothetical protein D3C78_1150650 [compost metagenome]